jgi:ATP-dependent Clp endopeptidase proteolytic subunit ClpP
LKTISIEGVIGYDVTPANIRKSLVEANGEDVRIEINSPGGYVYDGITIFNLLKNYSGNVTTHIMGVAASMASVIALSGNVRSAEKNTVFMIHNAWACACGDHNDLMKQAKHLESLSGMLALIYAEKTGKKLKEIKQMMDNDTYLYGDEIKDAGFVSETIGEEKEDKENSLISAKASISDCKKTMDELDNYTEDIENAAACVNKDLKNNKKKEVATMATEKEKELEKENAELKSKLEKAEKVEPKVEPKVEGENSDVKYAKAYLNNKDYPTLGEMAADVITGKVDIIALQASVNAIDHATEAAKSSAAAIEQNRQPETAASDIESDDVIEAQIEANLNNGVK